jgi:hypothetical protein
MSLISALTRRTARRTAAVLAAATVAAAPLVVDLPAHAQEPGPIHAGNTYGWYRGNSLTRYEFIGRTDSFWKVRGAGVVRNQHGMLTLNTTRKGSVSATLDRAGHAYGRWEMRLRAKRYSSAAANYQVMTELVPAGKRKQHCGGQNISLESYRLGSNRAKFYIHTLPRNTFHAFRGMNLGNDRWHTFAVEVSKTHISWFVDAHVVNTERRPAALSGVPLTVRFTMKAAPGKTMNKSRMQMDWLRYWGYQHPTRKSIKAPQTTPGRFAAC